MTDFFSQTVLAHGGQIESIALNAGQTVDIGWFGSSEPKRVFIHSSRDEAGSSIQLQWLEQTGIGPIPADGAIAIVRGLTTQAAPRYQLYLSTRLLSAEHIVVIDVCTDRGGSGGPGNDRLVIEKDNLYSRMLPLAKVEYAVQEFGGPGLLFRNRWRAQVLESGKEVMDDQLARLF